MFVRSRTKLHVFISLFTTFLFAMTSLGACGNQSTTSTPIKIGTSLPTTGDLAPDGAHLKQGYETWAKVVNGKGGLLGRQIQMVFKSDDATAAQTTTNYTQLITNDKVDLLFGTFNTVNNRAAAEVALRYNHLLISPTANTSDISNLHLKNLFAVSLPIDHYLASFVSYLLALPVGQRPSTIGFAGIDNVFATSQIDYAKQMLQDNHNPLQIVVDERPYQAETTDFSPLAQQIINAQPDVAVIGSLSVDECVGFIKAFKQQKYNPKAILCSSGPDQGGDFTKPIGIPTAEGVFVPNSGWYPALKTFGNEEFTKTYLAKNGGTADDISNDTVQAYSAGQVLEQAVKKIKSIDHTKLIQELSIDTFDSLQGSVKFGPGGDNTAAVAFLYQWQSGHLLAVYPVNSGQASPEYPKKKWPA